MLPHPRRVFKIIAFKVKLPKLHENSKFSKYSICRQNDNENQVAKIK